MPGEIDFDTLLIASVLRVTRPDLFALVSEHIEVFRGGLSVTTPVAGEKRPHKVVEQIDKLLESDDERGIAAFRALLSFVFPQYPPGGAYVEKEYISRPQALFVNRHADYWQRYLAQVPVDEATSDQSALASIVAWRERKPSDLVNRIVDPRRNAQIAQFVGQFTPADLCLLLRDVAERLAPESASGWEDRAFAPGVTAVWAMMLARPPLDALLSRTVLDIVRRAAPMNLPLANNVTYFYAESHHGVPDLMTALQRQDIARTLREALPENFTGKGAEERLLRALNGGSPWLIFWVTTRIASTDGQSGIPFERWPEFANVLLNLAETQPAIAVPHIVSSVRQSNMPTGYLQNEDGAPERVGSWVGHFDADTAKRFFDYDRLTRVLVTFEVPNDLDEEMKASCRAAVKAAAEYASTLPEP